MLPCPIGAFCAGGAAKNVSCYPATACNVAGLSAQPPCYWNVSTLAGRSTSGFSDGVGTSAAFNQAFDLLVLPNSTLLVVDESNGAIRSITNGIVTTAFTGLGNPVAVIADANGTLYVTESSLPSRVSTISPSGVVSAFAGSSTIGSANGIGTSAQFTGPVQLAFNQTTSIIVADFGTNNVRSIDIASRAVTAAAGSGALGNSNGPALAATFSDPYGIAVNASGAVFIADNANNNIRLLYNGVVSTYAGGGAAIEGPCASAVVTAPQALALDALGSLIVPSDNRVRMISSSNRLMKTLAGSGAGAVVDGFGTAASFNVVRGIGLAPSGTIYVSDNGGSYIRQLTCVPCPSSYFCFSGVPVLCPAGSYCPLSSINATRCPKGSFSAAGASNCTLCPAGTFAAAAGSASCQRCPGGHYCPAGSSSWALPNCGSGSYCLEGSAAPVPCPVQVPPPGGWGPLQAQGPAFLVETAQCLNHCFWNFTSGDGLLSKC